MIINEVIGSPKKKKEKQEKETFCVVSSTGEKGWREPLGSPMTPSVNRHQTAVWWRRGLSNEEYNT